MKNMTRILAGLIALCLVLSLAGSGFSAERMTYEEFQKQLQAYQARETAAKQGIDAENALIADLNAKLADLDKQIAAVWEQVYASINTTKEGVAAFNKKMDEIDARLTELTRMTPEQLLGYAAELDQIAATIAEMQKDPITKLSNESERLAQLAARVATLKASLPKPKNDMYSVVRGDCLWRIAGKKDIYGDPWKWLRIWSYNKTAIKHADLIYPKQQFTIPRQLTKDEYVVVRGDNLKKIAGRPEVYGDPFAWTKLYQANKAGDFLNDPKDLRPEMILSIPRN